MRWFWGLQKSSNGKQTPGHERFSNLSLCHGCCIPIREIQGVEKWTLLLDGRYCKNTLQRQMDRGTEKWVTNFISTVESNKGTIRELREHQRNKTDGKETSRNILGCPVVRPHRSPKSVTLLVSSISTYKDTVLKFRLASGITRVSLRAGAIGSSNQWRQSSEILTCYSCHGSFSHRTYKLRCQGGMKSKINNNQIWDTRSSTTYQYLVLKAQKPNSWAPISFLILMWSCFDLHGILLLITS